MKSTTEKQKKINLRVYLLAVSNLMLIIFISVLITPPAVTAGGLIATERGLVLQQGETRLAAFTADRSRREKCIVINKTKFYFHERTKYTSATAKDRNIKDLLSLDPKLVKQEVLHADTQLFKLYPQYRFGLYRALPNGKFLRSTMELESDHFLIFSRNFQREIIDISTKLKPDRIFKTVLFQKISKIKKQCQGHGRHSFNVWDDKHG